MLANVMVPIVAVAMMGLASAAQAAPCSVVDPPDAFSLAGNNTSCELPTLSVGDHIELFGEFRETATPVTQEWVFDVDAVSAAEGVVNITLLSNITGITAQFRLNGALQGSPVGANELLTLSGITAADTLGLVVTAQAVAAGGGNYTGNINIVPLPGALALMGTALAGLGVARWRQRRASPNGAAAA